MKKILTFIFVIIIFNFSLNLENCYSQEKNKKQDSIFMKRLSQLYINAYDLYYQNLPGVAKYADTIKLLSENNNFEKGLSFAYEVYAIDFMNKNKFSEANENFNKSLDLYNKYKDTLNLANIHNHLGILFNVMYLYDKSIYHYLEGIKLYEAIGNLMNVGRSYYNLSNIYLKISNKIKQKELLYKAQEILIRAKSDFGVSLTKTNLALNLIEEGNYDLAWNYYNEAETIFRKTDYPAAMIGIYEGKGRIYEKRNKINEAEKFFYKGYQLSMKLSLFGNALNLSNHYTNVLIKKNLIDSALSFLYQLDSNLYNTKSFEELHNNYDIFSKIYTKLNQYDSAFKYSQLSSSMKDSIYNTDMLNRISQIDVIFSIYEKDKYIKSLEQEKTISKLEIQRNVLNFRLLIILTSSMAILVLLIFIFIFYRNKKKNEKAKLKEKIADTESKLQLILEGTDQGIYGVDLNGNCTFINKSGADLLAYTPEECIGKKMHDLIHHSHFDGSKYPIEECPLSKISIDRYRVEGEYLIRKDGSKFIAEFSSNPLYENGKLAGSVITFFDISERAKADEALKESEKKYRLLADYSGDVIWTMDLEGKFNYISPSVYTLRGFTPDEVMKQKPEEVVCPDSMQYLMKGFELAFEEIRTGIRHEETYFEIEQPKKDGTTVWTEAIGRVMYNDNQPVGIVGVTRNIEDRKKAQEEKNRLLDELQKANELLEVSVYQKNALIGELSNAKEELEHTNSEKDKFFSILAHDLKSPFSGFLGLTQLFANDIDSFTKDELQEIGKNMQDSANNLYKLLDNLLQWSRIQRGKIEYNPENFLLNALIDQNLKLQSEVARQKEIELINLVPDNSFVFADIPMINTVVRNLLSNALKFTPRGGNIQVGIAKDSNEAMIKLFVQDSGIGMPSKIKDNLFKIDQKISRPGTENEPSTDLGLLLCKEFILKNKGEIHVVSKVGFGSVFYVTLPRN